MRSIIFFLCLPMFMENFANAAQPDLSLAQSIVKIIAHSDNGKNSIGSGVVIDDNLIATNCHVIRKANKIFIMKALIKYQVISRSAIPELDICLLQTQKMQLPSVPLGQQEKTKIGDDIYIFGYPKSIGPSFLRGSVIAFHPYKKSRIIEVDTGFMQGSSGGGVFNETGELIGLTTFMGRRHQTSHFYAIPIDWLINAMQMEAVSIAPFKTQTFWETGSFRHLLN